MHCEKRRSEVRTVREYLRMNRHDRKSLHAKGPVQKLAHSHETKHENNMPQIVLFKGFDLGSSNLVLVDFGNKFR